MVSPGLSVPAVRRNPLLLLFVSCPWTSIKVRHAALAGKCHNAGTLTVLGPSVIGAQVALPDLCQDKASASADSLFALRCNLKQYI